MAFLAAHPEIVYWGFARTCGHASYVLKEFPFGSNFRADFVVLHAYSGAWEVHFVELEPPKDKIITKKGVASARLNQAVSQIGDWRQFVENNKALVQKDLADWCIKKDLLGWFRDKCDPSNYTNDFLKDPGTFVWWHYHIVIGRRQTASGDIRRKMNQMGYTGYAEIKTFDRFIDIAGNFDRHHENPDLPVRLTETEDEKPTA